MKRSEVAKWMVTYWTQMDDHKIISSIDLSLETKMEYLLQGLESMGMQPPKVPTVKIGNTVIRSKNEWESED